MGFWSKFGYIAKLIGKGAAQSGMWALEQSEKISDAMDADNSSKARDKNDYAKGETDFCQFLQEENAAKDAYIKETQKELEKLEKKLETVVKSIELQYDSTCEEIEDMKNDIEKLQKQLDQCKEYQRKAQIRYILTTVIGGIGIAAAIVIAILL